MSAKYYVQVYDLYSGDTTKKIITPPARQEFLQLVESDYKTVIAAFEIAQLKTPMTVELVMEHNDRQIILEGVTL